LTRSDIPRLHELSGEIHSRKARVTFTQSDFHRIAEIMERHTGVVLRNSGKFLVYARLIKHIRTLGLRSFSEYCALLSDKTTFERERDTLIAALTTGFTALYREPHHFEYLEALMRNTLGARIKAGKEVRLWSAGCSSGEEPLSMALTLLACDAETHLYDVKILATDINHRKLEVARSILHKRFDFSRNSLQFGNSGPLTDQKRAVISETAHRLVDFRYMNLIDAWPGFRPFDVIFCRNVAIYFHHKTNATLWQRLSRALRIGGLLCVGHAEHIPECRTLGLEPCGITSYRKVA